MRIPRASGRWARAFIVHSGWVFSVALAILALYPWRSPLTGTVALGAFDLDDIGTKIGQDLPGPRPGEHAGEFKDFEPGERGLRIARRIEPHGERLGLAADAGQVTPCRQNR